MAEKASNMGKKEKFPRQQRYTKDCAHTLIFFLRKLWEIKAVLNRNGSYPPASDKLTPQTIRRHINCVVSKTCGLIKGGKKNASTAF